MQIEFWIITIIYSTFQIQTSRRPNIENRDELKKMLLDRIGYVTSAKNKQVKNSFKHFHKLSKCLLFIANFFLCLNCDAQSELWGMTSEGGQDGGGIIFKHIPNNNAYEIVHEFEFNEGSKPTTTSLTICNNGSIYGLTNNGGAFDRGIIFKCDKFTNKTTKIFEFNPNSGVKPEGKLIETSSGKLYGLTRAGGINNGGVLFQFDTSSNSYVKKWVFDSYQQPTGSLLLVSDSLLYGATEYGGTNNIGTIFKFNLVTNQYFKLFDFSNSISGRYPIGNLIIGSNNSLYGYTSSGGSNNYGVLFEYNLNTLDYTVKVNFNGTANGDYPIGSLLTYNDTSFFGATNSGGIYGKGVFFRYNPITNIFTKLIDFNLSDGIYPTGFLVESSNGNIIGVTRSGGSIDTIGNYGKGVIFEFDINSSLYKKRHVLKEIENGSFPYGALDIGDSSTIFSMTSEGGYSNKGTIFKFNPISNTYNKIIDFGSINGNTPEGSLLVGIDGLLYGVTSLGGKNDKGVLFSFDPVLKIYKKRHEFSVLNDGNPNGFLIQATDGKIYGTAYGGSNNRGVLFRFNSVTDSFTIIHEFDNYYGGDPFGSLIQFDDSLVFGLTSSGGIYNSGVIFKVNINTGKYERVYQFYDSIGSYPLGALFKASDGLLYGLTRNGGVSDKGVLFQFNPYTNTYLKKIDFNGIENGDAPYGTLVESEGKLYGLTLAGGSNNDGVLFSYELSSSNLNIEFSFLESTCGQLPHGSLIIIGEQLYGLTSFGGAFNKGVYFRFNINSKYFEKILDFNGVNGSNPVYTNLTELNTTSTEELENNNSVFNLFFPNPSAGLFNLILKENSEVCIRKILVKVIFQTNIPAGNQQVDLRKCSNGIYFATMKQGNFIQIKKLIIN